MDPGRRQRDHYRSISTSPRTRAGLPRKTVKSIHSPFFARAFGLSAATGRMLSPSCHPSMA